MTEAAGAGADALDARDGGLARIARSAWTLPALGLALAALQAGGAAAQLSDSMRGVAALILLQGALWLACVGLLMRGARIGLGWVLGVAVILRLTILFLPPYLSDDIYRYIWDGRVQGAGINPYIYIPNDPALAGLRDASVWPLINRAEYAPTIYPPVAQMLFFVITRVASGAVGMKIAWMLFEALTTGAVVLLLDSAKMPRGRLLIYAWCPLVVWEIAGSGHLDAAMAAFVSLALLARIRNRDGIAGLFLGFAVLVKFFPLAIAPALWRRGDWRLPAACAGVIAASYLIYISAGRKVLGFLSGYSHEEGLESGAGFWFAHLTQRTLSFVTPPLVYVGLVAVVLGGLALVVMRSHDIGKTLPGALALAALGMIALTPNHPWYFVWLTPLLCFTPSLPVLWLLAANPLLYWPNPYDWPWNADVVYGGLCVMALLEAFRIGNLRLRPNGVQP